MGQARLGVEEVQLGGRRQAVEQRRREALELWRRREAVKLRISRVELSCKPELKTYDDCSQLSVEYRLHE
jgi:hypothetical protein